MMFQSYLKVVSAVILLASCNSHVENHVEIRNDCDRELTSLRFSYANTTFERATLGPGELIRFSPAPRTDGGISLSYISDGVEVDHALGYATPMIPMKCEIEIDGAEFRGGCIEN
jgi:hypothetical protein